MSTSDPLIVRRVLASLLDRLEGGARPGAENTAPENAAPPVVLIMIGQPGDKECSCRGAAASGETFSTAARPPDKACPHPGLSRFDIEEESPQAQAPRSCFMEPDRVCVNSGACEMLGY
jgi:hypothetical protein